MKTSKLVKTLLAAGLMAGVAGVAHAGSATGNIAVSASVAQACTITANPVAFGAYDPIVTNASTPLEATGTLAITCTKGATSVWVSLGNGSYYSGGRRMQGATTTSDYLNYELYLPTAATPAATCGTPHSSGTAWYATNGTNTLNPASTAWDGTSKSFNVCGTVAAGQSSVSAQNYADTVVATVNF